ncbi:DNA polymerase IV [Candidatus Arcanobacter lacustris]|uniref:DNA-directed DNA polymerase n=1 Tax=Candidatus Arcanibacter lacustris TaxID=1607817 RepID=A0A0F5MNR3_9RICK|nr:DNA polymerase IV [Candidatus Arcanobacter lacustris]
MSKVFSLIDGNNFYVSCERIFNPSLENKPVIVLSSNDGCVIARSNEVKSLGIKMGEPYFKILPLVKTNNIKVLSANFALYGDISRRMMNIITSFAVKSEIYSIDECFLDFSDLEIQEITKISTEIRIRVKKWLGIPVSIGIGQTKTLAKLANQIAKRNSNGCHHLLTIRDIKYALASTLVKDIWGIGYKYASKLNDLKIYTANDLVNADDQLIRKNTNILGLKTTLELRGKSCIDLEEVADPKKSITVSRSFSRDIQEFEELSQAIAYFTARAAEKLRSSNQMTKSFSIFIQSNPFAKDSKAYSNSCNITLPYPTDSTPELLNNINKALIKIYHNDYSYKKAGILLYDLQAKSTKSIDLFDKRNIKRDTSLMNALDQINQNYGRRTIFIASTGISHSWLPKSNMKSDGYVSNWNEIVRVV